MCQFDENLAKLKTQELPQQALAKCAAMNKEHIEKFVELFNNLHDLEGRSVRLRIIHVEERTTK